MKKCYYLGDYIAFILPISQLNNTYIFYEFDLIYSQDMGKNIYTDRNIHCCFNIYKRPENGLNKKIKYNFKDFILYDDHNLSTPSSSIINIYKNKTYDFKICAWGAKCGQILNKEESYKKEIIFVINNINKKEEIYNCVKNWDISKVLQTSTPVLPMWKIYKYISENINDIQ